jgi:hypothetical protein
MSIVYKIYHANFHDFSEFVKNLTNYSKYTFRFKKLKLSFMNSVWYIFTIAKFFLLITTF